LAVAVLVVAAVTWALGTHSEQAAAPSPTTAPRARPATTAPAAPAGHAPLSATVPAPTPAPILEDGRHPVFLTEVDAAGSTVQFDLVQYLTGDALRDYEQEEREYDPDFETYDYYVLNESTRLRRLPVMPGLAVSVLRTPDSAFDEHPIAFTDLPGYVDDLPGASTGHLGGSVFWLTVRDDTVVAMEEQFSP
jgi:hypothetical protein